MNFQELLEEYRKLDCTDGYAVDRYIKLEQVAALKGIENALEQIEVQLSNIEMSVRGKG